MKVAVVGLGLIGGSIALDLKAKGFASEVIGVDKNEDHVTEALSLGLVDRASSIEEICLECDLIVLCIPVDALSLLLPRVLDSVGPNVTVTDVGSTKSKIIEKIKNHPKKEHFVPSHPMAGTEFSGPKAAHRGLFKNKVTVICDPQSCAEVHLKKVTDMYEALQMKVLHMDAKEHDLNAAYVSHLSHISSFVLASTVLDKEKNVTEIFNLAGAGFESTVRLAKSSPDMWAPIFEQNHDFIVEALASYIDHLKIFHLALVTKNYQLTKALMGQSNEIKRVLEVMSGKGKSNE